MLIYRRNNCSDTRVPAQKDPYGDLNVLEMYKSLEEAQSKETTEKKGIEKGKNDRNRHFSGGKDRGLRKTKERKR